MIVSDVNTTALEKSEMAAWRSHVLPNLRCTVSPDEPKRGKLAKIIRTLTGPGLIITPDSNGTDLVCDVLDDVSYRFIALSSVDRPEEYLKKQNEFLSHHDQSLVIEEELSRYITSPVFHFIVFWSMPETVRDFVHTFKNLSKSVQHVYVVLLYNPQDRYYHENIISVTAGSQSGSLKDRRLTDLDVMEGYAVVRTCRLRYLNVALDKDSNIKECGNCDNCRISKIDRSVQFENEQENVLTVLLCIAETREKFGKNILIDVLLGKATGRIKRFGLHKAGTFGSLHYKTRKNIEDLFEILFENGYLKRTLGVYPTIFLSPVGKKMIGAFFVHPINLPKRYGLEEGETVDRALIETLRNFRRRRAKELNIPAFSLFPDGVLKRIAQKSPVTEDELKKVIGFGNKKWNVCGEDLLNLIRSNSAEM